MNLNRIRNYLGRTHGASRSYIENAEKASNWTDQAILGNNGYPVPYRMNDAIRFIAEHARNRENNSYIFPEAHFPPMETSRLEKLIRKLVR
nr:hypothetical protein [Nanoarchaeum sp.]